MRINIEVYNVEFDDMPFVKKFFNVLNDENANQAYHQFYPNKPWHYYVTLGPDYGNIFPLLIGQRIKISIAANTEFSRCRYCGAFLNAENKTKKNICSSCSYKYKTECTLGEEINDSCENFCHKWRQDCAGSQLLYFAGYIPEFKLKVGITHENRLAVRAREAGYSIIVPIYHEGGRTFSRPRVIQLEGDIDRICNLDISKKGFCFKRGSNPVEGTFSETMRKYTFQAMLPLAYSLQKFKQESEKILNKFNRNSKIKLILGEPMQMDYSDSIDFAEINAILEDGSRFDNWTNLGKPYNYVDNKIKIKSFSGSVVGVKYPAMILKTQQGGYQGLNLRSQNWDGKTLYLDEYARMYKSWLDHGKKKQNIIE